MSTGGTEKAAHQKNSPLSINDKTKKKKKVLVRVGRLNKTFNNSCYKERGREVHYCHLHHRETVEMPLTMRWLLGKHGAARKEYVETDRSLTA